MVLEHAVHEHLLDVERRGIARQERPLLDQKHTLAGVYELIGGAGPTRAATNNDHVILVRHDVLPESGNQGVTLKR